MLMQLLKTETFEKDVKRLDGSYRKRLKKVIQKIIANPESGKPMEHFSNVFSERIESFRLICRVKNNELLLLCFKNRDEAYQHLRALQHSL